MDMAIIAVLCFTVFNSILIFLLLLMLAPISAETLKKKNNQPKPDSFINKQDKLQCL